MVIYGCIGKVVKNDTHVRFTSHPLNLPEWKKKYKQDLIYGSSFTVFL